MIRRRTKAFALKATILWAMLSVLYSGGAFAGTPVSFSRDIQPLLAENCLKCHGGVKEAGKLNLQFRERALEGGTSGEPAIVPGNPDASTLIKRLVTADEDDRMPKKGPPLKPVQVALLKQWIAQGAKWEKHWAYEPPKPSGKTLDVIVKAHLAKEHLSFSLEADRWILARRTALDLTGIPAPLAEVEKFVHDSAPRAYERWVDRLLASPGYGERWAATWLDLARYSDSKGYEKDGFRDMWRYRDWVIDALNRDEPYDKFLEEQLAGDLLPDPTDDDLIATAFHRNTQTNDEGGTDDEEYRTYAVLDRLNTTFEVVQGTTMGCVQCHGHPYDPFVHDEYYRLLAFFNNTADADREDEAPTRPFYRSTDIRKAANLKQVIAFNNQKLETDLGKDENKKAFEAWTGEMLPLQQITALKNFSVSSTDGKYDLADDDKILLKGAVPNRTTITVETEIASAPFQALALQVLPDDSLPSHGPGGVDSGNFVLSSFEAVLIGADGKTETPLVFTNGDASYEQENFPAKSAVKLSKDGKKEGRGWAIGGGTGKMQMAVFYLATPVSAESGAKLRITLRCEDPDEKRHVVGCFRLAVAQINSLESFTGLPADLRKILLNEPASWKPEQRAKLERHFFSAKYPDMESLYATLDKDRAALAALPVCNLLVMQELPPKDSRVTHVFHRGNWQDKDNAVTPATPTILNSWHADYPTNRLGLAKWLTNGENPLTARVQVNRIWEQLFGIGLVETLEDFGTQGDKPAYQDLLDDLAARFQTDMKWSQKALVREIVLSRVYRQSSKASKSLLQRDPANRLLARGPRFRLTSEQLRDQALALSGLLSPKMFGPPVMPFQPPGMWLTPYSGHDWENSPGEDGHRRALYTFIRRSATYPSFVTFDSPSREFCLARRTRTNTPLQALDLLDSPVFFEAATNLAKRMETEGGADVDKQIERGLFLARQRPPDPDEVAILKKLYAQVGNNLTLVANSILNLDEVLNKN